MKAGTMIRMAGLPMLGILLASGCARVKPDETGVLTHNFGSDEGIDPQDYGPGYHRFLWPLHSWQRFPSTVQGIRFAKDSSQGWASTSDAIQVTSADGDRVVLTAEVFFKIAEGQAHHVLQDSGPGERYRDVVKGLALDASRVLFGRLGTEAFYDPAKREAVRREAVAQLRRTLTPRGIELVDLLVESVEFEASYEDLISKKKLADQRVLLEKAKGRAAEETGKVNKIKAESAVKIQTMERESEIELARRATDLSLQIGRIKTEADRYASGLRADSDLYKSQKEAEGLTLVKTAEADGARKMNEALVGEGGRNIVALEAMKRVNLTDVTFPSTSYDWFNPHEMSTHMGASAEPASTNKHLP